MSLKWRTLTTELPWWSVKFFCLSKAMVDYKSTISIWLMASVRKKSHEFRLALGTTMQCNSHAGFPRVHGLLLHRDLMYSTDTHDCSCWLVGECLQIGILFWQKGSCRHLKIQMTTEAGDVMRGSSHVGPHCNKTFKCDKC